MIPSTWSLALMLALASIGRGEVRTWTHIDGKQMQAEIVSANEKEVVVKLASNGATHTLPIQQLSVVDGTYINHWLEKQAAGESQPYENWDAPWPSLISGKVSLDITTVEEDESKKRYIYQSENYEFVCDVKLNKNTIKRFATQFESTHDFVSALPLSLEKTRQKKRHLVMLFETEETYWAKGGPQGSAGVYTSSGDLIMVPLTSLGVIASAGGYRVDYDRHNMTLSHELTHQLTDHAYFGVGASGWFSEGLAEYVARTPYRSGKFNLRNNHSAFKAYVTSIVGDTITLPDLKTYMLQDYPTFVADAARNYMSALLIVHYFFHWDGDGDAANIKAFLKALKQGKRGEEALNALLAGRTYKHVQDEITKAWRTRGIKIEFPPT